MYCMHSMAFPHRKGRQGSLVGILLLLVGFGSSRGSFLIPWACHCAAFHYAWSCRWSRKWTTARHWWARSHWPQHDPSVTNRALIHFGYTLLFTKCFHLLETESNSFGNFLFEFDTAGNKTMCRFHAPFPVRSLSPQRQTPLRTTIPQPPKLLKV